MSRVWRRYTLTTVCLLAACAVAQSTSVPVARRDLCVTNGVISETGTGAMLIESASSRAIAPNTDGRSAELRFRYLGRSADTKPLASGELRQQIGLKLRSMNQCNLLYVMWHIEPDSKLAVLIKSNPGQHTHGECGARGYATIKSATDVRPPKPVAGEWHVLRAELKGMELTVTADGAAAWRGTLPQTLLSIDGPAGIRSDNARFAFTLSAGAVPARSVTGCRSEAGD